MSSLVSLEVEKLRREQHWTFENHTYRISFDMCGIAAAPYANRPMPSNNGSSCAWRGGSRAYSTHTGPTLRIRANHAKGKDMLSKDHQQKAAAAVKAAAFRTAIRKMGGPAVMNQRQTSRCSRQQ
ncbi:hypothetical protein HaLaN_15896 [Haematococcus lacustris]|uniref:Uncharacterized protein n=1 Tax=Haematococcus lacustris TaxID=44745 RepID=A0A699ZA24_HAELA|nr:hypothetical protein HaLaN_15896 [Haematococcus lacustris]